MKFNLGLFIFLTLGLTVYTQENFKYHGDSMEAQLVEGREKTILNGNVQMTSDSTQIEADKLELSGTDFRFAFATGNVVASNSDKGVLLRCQELRYDRELKISLVSGEALMEDQKNEMVVKGGYLENHEKEDLIIIQIGVRIFKKDMTARGQYARFNRSTDLLELSGLPVVIYKGDTYRARKITINVKTNEITMEGEVSGSVVRKKEDEPIPATPPVGTEAVKEGDVLTPATTLPETALPASSEPEPEDTQTDEAPADTPPTSPGDQP